MRRSVMLVWAAFGLCLAAPAGAQAPPDEATKNTARALAETGRKRFEAGDYAGAIEALRDAEGHVRAPTIVRLRALAHEQLGQLLEAREAYQAIAEEQLSASAPPEFVAAQEQANKALAGLATRIPAVRIVMAHAPPGTRVTLDDRPLDPAALAAPIQLNPGPHVVAFEPPRAARISREVNLKERSVETVEVDLAPPGQAVTAQPTVRPTSHAGPAAAVPAGGRSLLGPAIGIGLGGVGLIVGAITGGLSFVRAGEIRRDCDDPPVCPPGYRDRVEDGKVLGHIATAGFIVAGGGAAAGMVLLLWPGKVAAPARVGVAFGPGFLAVKGAL